MSLRAAQFRSIRAAIKAEPDRVHLFTAHAAKGPGHGKPIPYSMTTFDGPREGHLPPKFALIYYCVGVHGATQLGLWLRVGESAWPGQEPIFAYDLGYHSVAPQYEEQGDAMECDLVEGGRCYYDGSGLQAEQVLGDKLLTADSGAAWDDAAFEVVLSHYERVFSVRIARKTLSVRAVGVAS